MSISKRTRINSTTPVTCKRPRKLGFIIRNDEYYSPEDLAAIREGEEAIKQGDTISLEEFCRREGL